MDFPEAKETQDELQRPDNQGLCTISISYLLPLADSLVLLAYLAWFRDHNGWLATPGELAWLEGI